MAATIPNVALNAVRDNLRGVAGAPSLVVTWIAVGTGVQATPATATQLASEVFRKQLTNSANGASVGEALLNGYLAAGDSSGTAITEVGFFAGNASSAANSGTLMFYATYSHTHAAGESIQLTIDTTV